MKMYGIKDEETGGYIDDDCVFKDKTTGEINFLSFDTYENYIYLNQTYQHATEMLNRIKIKCDKFHIHRQLNIVPIQI
jgi:agmatine/peptidylarginine deiminase